jgi:hypothetical protein
MSPKATCKFFDDMFQHIHGVNGYVKNIYGEKIPRLEGNVSVP